MRGGRRTLPAGGRGGHRNPRPRQEERPRGHGNAAEPRPPGAAPLPHGQGGGPVTPPSPEAGSVLLTALQADLTAANVVLVPDSTPRQRRARAGAREGIARDGRRARFQTGGSKRRPRDCGWQREPRREASHSYQLFTKHQRSPRAPHRFSRDLAFSPIPAPPITTPLVLSIPYRGASPRECLRDLVFQVRDCAQEPSSPQNGGALHTSAVQKNACTRLVLPYKKMAAHCALPPTVPPYFHQRHLVSRERLGLLV